MNRVNWYGTLAGARKVFRVGGGASAIRAAASSCRIAPFACDRRFLRRGSRHGPYVPPCQAHPARLAGPAHGLRVLTPQGSCNAIGARRSRVAETTRFVSWWAVSEHRTGNDQLGARGRAPARRVHRNPSRWDDRTLDNSLLYTYPLGYQILERSCRAQWLARTARHAYSRVMFSISSQRP